MKATRNIKDIEVTIIMTGDEAKWLKKVLQNTIGGVILADESILNTKMRKIFWHVLNREGV